MSDRRDLGDIEVLQPLLYRKSMPTKCQWSSPNPNISVLPFGASESEAVR